MRTRPPKFSDPEELQEKIDEFFEECKTENIIPTVTGLAVALDTNRQILLDYQNFCNNTDRLKSLDESVKVQISDTIKRAKARIEAGYEQQLLQAKNPAGAIFTLKNNYAWRDKQEIEQTNRTISIDIDEEE